MSEKKQVQQAIRIALLKQGYSVASWARQNNFTPSDVHTVLRRYAGNPHCPERPRPYAILTQLSKDTGIDLIKAG